jgi:hypothetical protein
MTKQNEEYEREIVQLKDKLANADAKVAELENRLSLYQDRDKSMFDMEAPKLQREHEQKLALLELEKLKVQRDAGRK